MQVQNLRKVVPYYISMHGSFEGGLKRANDWRRGAALVEGIVLVLCNLLWVAHPDGLLLVDQLPFM